MPASDSPAVLVARFLQANNYAKTLEAFLQEAGLPPDAAASQANDLTIENVLQEKKIFDLSINFEKVAVDDAKGWSTPAPSKASIVESLPSQSNLLHVSLEDVIIPGPSMGLRHAIVASTADRKLSMVATSPPGFDLLHCCEDVQDSPILACRVLRRRYLLCTSMSGKLVLFDCRSNSVLETRRDHTKYAVSLATWETEEEVWIATAGWDGKVMLYRAVAAEAHLTLGKPAACLTLSSNPEALQFVAHPTTKEPILIVTRRDSTFLYYYTVRSSLSDEANSGLPLLGKQNLAPHSNAWIAFTPSDISQSPVDCSLLAVATSSVPHMKLIVVRLLLPDLPYGVASVTTASNPEAHNTQASQARAALALQEVEASAILLHCNTFAPQTVYSTPRLAWRPDGSGIWVSGDDGVVRGLDSRSGRVVETLKAHEPGSKIRCLWAGRVGVGEDDLKEERLVSGGFDQKLIVWSP